ncbi:hypothetical protein CCAX7_000720 [Capsulimonas corticalis]|uniref:Uncharacterized protein n=1 Tax=Capsulimonas corticalis TaxID=2219043 RepID=A0A402CRI7_9BACT|nr:hypothetical protein [Capsulimonas corticalis]BDI28021.1 hypothetical protein CCAX7_000720 [Capsulimonas corticalis]
MNWIETDEDLLNLDHVITISRGQKTISFFGSPDSDGRVREIGKLSFDSKEEMTTEFQRLRVKLCRS